MNSVVFDARLARQCLNGIERENQTEKEDDMMYKQKDRVEAFVAYCRDKAHVPELISFFEEVVKLRSMHMIGDIVQQVQKIKTTYIKSGSEMEINIDSLTRKTTEDYCVSLFKGRICQVWINRVLEQLPNVFELALKQVLLLLRDDVWPRFCEYEREMNITQPLQLSHIVLLTHNDDILGQSWADFVHIWTEQVRLEQ